MSRTKAGRALAAQIAKKYRNENCAILALDDGGVIVGAQIANRLHCIMMLLLSNEIKLPLEPDPIAGITSGGDFAYNSRYSSGEIDEFTMEFRGLIDQEKLAGMHDLNKLVSKGSVINKKLLKNKIVIIVSDGFKDSFNLDLALAFLKTIEIKRLIIATPLASVPAVDRMHIAGDEIYCLSVIEDYINTAHYYDEPDVPEHNEVIKLLKDTLMKWI